MTDVQSLLKQEFRNDLKWNQDMMEQILGCSVDLMKRKFLISTATEKLRGECFFYSGLVNAQVLDDDILDPLMNYVGDSLPHGDELLDHLLYEVITNTELSIVRTFDAGIGGLLAGDTLVFLETCDQALLVSTRGWDSRSVDEPQTEPVVRGPRDGFTENIRTNTALVRRRIRDPQLRFDSTTVGTRTKTDVNIAYIEGTVKDGLVDEIKQRLSKIKIDGVLESGYIEELIEDEPLSIFTTIQSTERPDKVAASLLEGRVAIFVDNTPFVLIAPSNFWQFFQASDDYYSRYWVGSFFRLIRYAAFFISLTLPAIYVMLVSFHHEMIPTPLALSIAAGRESVPLPALLEALLMELSFELIREAGLRLPKPVGQTVSIVGSLVIGQAAVQAGLVSPAMVIIVALTGISSFAIPNYATSFAIRMLRFPLLIASGMLGLLGFAAVFSIMTVHALSIRSFGESYLAPATPFNPTDQKDIIVRVPWWQMKQRPTLASDNSKRQGDQLMPEPPEEKKMSLSSMNPLRNQSQDDQQAEDKNGEQETKEEPRKKKRVRSKKQQKQDKQEEQCEDVEQDKQEEEQDKQPSSDKRNKPEPPKKKLRQRKEHREHYREGLKKERTWRKTQREK